MTTSHSVMSLLNGASIFPFVLLLGSTVDEALMTMALESSLSMALAGCVGLIFVCGEVISPDALKQKKLVNINAPAANDAYAEIYRVADFIVDDLDSDELTSLHSARQGGVPKHIDGRLLSTCREKLQRELKHSERRVARSKLLELARVKYTV